MNRAVWQISGGPSDRPYADVFLKYGVGLIGPGDAGAWHKDRDDQDFDGGFVRRFASEVKIGDAFLLRTGLSRIRAIGLVASDYVYLNQFDDVNGWDLQHGRRVRWGALPQEYEFEEPVHGARFSRVLNEEIVDYVNRFLNSPPTHWQTAPLPELHQEEPPLDEIPAFLQEHVAAVQDLFPLYSDSTRFGETPSEDELLVHFVVPLLRSLGWPPELIAVKWRYVDVTLFHRLPRTPENCYVVIEAKRLGQGVEGALGQAKGYLEDLQVSRDIVVTDGIRYRMYGHECNFEPVAYANLARLKKSALEFFNRLKRP